MHRWMLIGAVTLSLACTGCIAQFSNRTPPSPSAPRAYGISFKACKTAVVDYGVKRMAKYLDASGIGTRQLARAYVRRALQVTTGWQTYRDQGFRGCAAGIRAAT